MVGTNHQPPRLVSGARCGINSPHMSKCGTASGHVPPQQVVQEEGPGGGRVREVNIDREPKALVRSSLRVGVFGSNLVLFNSDLTKLSDHLCQHHYS